MRDLNSIISENEAAEQSWRAKWLQFKREIHDLAAYESDLNRAKVLMEVERLMDLLEKK